MTKSKAIQSIAALSSGTIANIIGSAKYERIDDAVNRWIITAGAMPDDAFTTCENWRDVLDIIGREAVTAYAQGMADFRRYIIQYSADRASAILDEYEQIIARYIRHGATIIDPAWEADYIRGGRDAIGA